jgi:hypothetical protein
MWHFAVHLRNIRISNASVKQIPFEQEKRGWKRERIVILTLALLTLSHAVPGTCVLAEGVGSDFAKVNSTLRDGKKKHLPAKIALEYDKDVLVRIIVSDGDCRTSAGIKLGDSESEVSKLYGIPKKTKPYVMKGGFSNLAKPGDWVDEYPGVAFLISEGKVTAFFIQKLPPEVSTPD